MFNNVWWIKRSKALQRNHKFQESYNVKTKESLKSLQVKPEAYLEPTPASTMELFCEYT